MIGPIFVSVVVFWGLALGGGFYWTRRYVRASERRAAALGRLAALEARVSSLEGAARVASLPAASPPSVGTVEDRS